VLGAPSIHGGAPSIRRRRARSDGVVPRPGGGGASSVWQRRGSLDPGVRRTGSPASSSLSAAPAAPSPSPLLQRRVAVETPCRSNNNKICPCMVSLSAVHLSRWRLLRPPDACRGHRHLQQLCPSGLRLTRLISARSPLVAADPVAGSRPSQFTDLDLQTCSPFARGEEQRPTRICRLLVAVCRRQLLRRALVVRRLSRRSIGCPPAPPSATVVAASHRPLLRLLLGCYCPTTSSLLRRPPFPLSPPRGNQLEVGPGNACGC
jgi:hypothetical protein